VRPVGAIDRAHAARTEFRAEDECPDLFPDHRPQSIAEGRSRWTPGGPIAIMSPMAADAQELARVLQAAEAGEHPDLERLLPLVYGELRRVAARQMAGERRGHTLQATALVHEAFLRLAGADRLTWKSKAHFFRAAADSMRRILIDHARARDSQKRGGKRDRVALSLAELAAEGDPAELLAVTEAVSRLQEVEPRAGAVAHIRLYAGLSMAETAEALDQPLRTVERDWAYARSWLYDRLK
jgi:RNA polymerase sigma factor (TIGR02999 family)